MKEGVPIKTVNQILKPADGSVIELSERCCGESGTFAIGRPDIASQVRKSKEESLRGASAKLKKDDFRGEIKILTTCPGCYQGMSRYSDAVKTSSEFLIVEMMKTKYGKNWMHKVLSEVKDGLIEKVLL